MKKLLLPAIIITLAGCAAKEPAPPVHDAAADKAAVDAVRNAEIEGLKSGKTGWVNAVYSSDVQMMPPGEAAVSGLAGVTAMLEGMYKTANISGQYNSSDVIVSGDYAIDHYTGMLQMSPFNGGKRTNEVIKGIHVYKRQPDGKWLITQDVWNTDPAPVAKK